MITQDEARIKCQQWTQKHGVPYVMEVFSLPWGGSSMYFGPPKETYDAYNPLQTWDSEEDIDWIRVWEFLQGWKQQTKGHRSSLRRTVSGKRLLQSHDKIGRRLRRFLLWEKIKKTFGRGKTE